MRILITNDDGISAPGLEAARDIAVELTGTEADIWVVAPAFEQSGVGHCVSYVRPMRIEHLGERRYAVEGSPADCVLAALEDIMRETPPDLILSGVNRGHNVAEDTLYSGTVGGAMEGVLHGYRAIAMSQYYGPASASDLDPYEAARKHGPGVIRKLLAGANWSGTSYRNFYNVNFPARPASRVKGVKATFQGHRPGAPFGVQPQTAPNGRRFLWLTHGRGNDESEPGSDSLECHNGYVTVTPLTADLTDRNQIPTLVKLLEQP